ncbi:MAG: hypothetical protein FH747_06655 [Stenotrophomonas sp.]|nr:hypothetical protein [Stenotrophomonas sp.]
MIVKSCMALSGRRRAPAGHCGLGSGLLPVRGGAGRVATRRSPAGWGVPAGMIIRKRIENAIPKRIVSGGMLDKKQEGLCGHWKSSTRRRMGRYRPGRWLTITSNSGHSHRAWAI